jgi:NADH-quinone oxidoreductase subunit N
MALLQTDIKRLLGYSSVAQAGNFAIGLAAIAATDSGTAIGASGVTFFIATYAFTNLGAFFCVLAISQKTGSDEISSYRGMYRRAPLLAVALALCLVSLTGLPPTAGFIAKLYVFNAAVQSDLVWLAIVGVLNTAISAFYYLRVVGLMFVVLPEEESAISTGPWLGAAVATSGLGVLVLFVLAAPVINAAERAVSAIS